MQQRRDQPSHLLTLTLSLALALLTEAEVAQVQQRHDHPSHLRHLALRHPDAPHRSSRLAASGHRVGTATQSRWGRVGVA